MTDNHLTYDQITDGFGNYYPAYCQFCGQPNEVVRPGKFQCQEGCDAFLAAKGDE